MSAFSYSGCLASIYQYLASLSDAYRLIYLARIGDPTITVLRKAEIPSKLHHKVTLSDTRQGMAIFTLHAGLTQTAHVLV